MAGHRPAARPATDDVSSQTSRGRNHFRIVVAPFGVGTNLTTLGFPSTAVTITWRQGVGDLMKERIADLLERIKESQMP